MKHTIDWYRTELAKQKTYCTCGREFSSARDFNAHKYVMRNS